jgi:hypothetical protein
VFLTQAGSQAESAAERRRRAVASGPESRPATGPAGLAWPGRRRAGVHTGRVFSRPAPFAGGLRHPALLRRRGQRRFHMWHQLRPGDGPKSQSPGRKNGALWPITSAHQWHSRLARSCLHYFRTKRLFGPRRRPVRVGQVRSRLRYHVGPLRPKWTGPAPGARGPLTLRGADRDDEGLCTGR